jgi:VWFA-related protein
VALVQVPVFVSGKDHGAAAGLKASDFTVRQDGKEVEIVSFQYIDTTSPELQEEIRKSPAARRRFLFLFDKSFTDPAGLAKARSAAKAFVRSGLSESDLVAVATFDFLRGIRLVANFTEDRRVIEHAIHTLGIPSLTRISDPLAMAADFQSSDLVAERDSGAQQETPGALLNDVIAALAVRARSAEDQSYKVRVGVLLDSLRLLGLSLRNVPGRKQVVYFSTGFSSTLLAGADKADQARTSEAIAAGRLWEVDSDTRYGDPDTRAILDVALRTLSRADAVVHSIDLSGLGAREQYNQLADASMATRDASGRESLGFIAAETGGRFFKDANDLEPVLREMADMTSRYYVLGVQPPESRPDGSFRKLQVRVKPKGLRLSHRPGFFERSPEVLAAPPLQRQFEAAELLVASGDAPGIDTVPFRVLIMPVPSDADRQSLGVVVQIPKASLTKGGGALELFGYAIARSGQVEDHFAHFLRLEGAFPTGTADGVEGLSFAGRFDVPAGDYTLKFLAQRPTGEASTRFFDVTVPRRQAAQGFLLPPLFADKPKTWVEVALRSRGEAGLPIRIELGGVPLMPRTDVTVRPGRRERVVLVAYIPNTAQDPATDVDIRSVLSDDTGKRFPVGALSVEQVVNGEDGRRSYVLAFTPQDVPPGNYTLRVHIGESSSVLQSYTRLKVLPRETADVR